ncbi:MAG TPA: hypothetical protein ENJ53_00150, partial [Phaeodactylibacter sp.]|nr:hypothetical protein [Phaeodactylibacter sp.]
MKFTYDENGYLISQTIDAP